MRDEDFFSDEIEDIQLLLLDIAKLFNYAKKNPDTTIIFPRDGLGTGLSQLSTKAPLCNKILSDLLLKYFGIKTDKTGKLFLKGYGV